MLATVGFTMRSTVHTTNRATPAQLVFNHDVIHNVGFEVDWQYIRQRRQCVVMQNNACENARRVDHTYKVGDKALVDQEPQCKHGEDCCDGPYRVAKVCQNGMVQLKHDTPKGGVLDQR